jgi:hypothetical protein
MRSKPFVLSKLLAVVLLQASCTQGSLKAPVEPALLNVDWSATERLKPGPTNGPFEAHLFPALVTPPSLDLPPLLRRLSGVWSGWMGAGRSGSAAVNIASIERTSAAGHYAFAGMANMNGSLPANREFGLNCEVIEEQYLKCKLLGNYTAGISLYLKIREDGNLMIQYTANGGRYWTRGLLSQA